jgi:hypothetical protein
MTTVHRVVLSMGHEHDCDKMTKHTTTYLAAEIKQLADKTAKAAAQFAYAENAGMTEVTTRYATTDIPELLKDTADLLELYNKELVND